MYDEMIARAARYQRPAPRPLLWWIAAGLTWAVAGSVVALLILSMVGSMAQCGAC